MARNGIQTDQVVNEAALAVLRAPARGSLDNTLAGIDQNLNSPLRMFASNPADQLLNFAPSEILQSDGTGKSVPPTSSTVPVIVASTLNLQTGAVTGATFVGSAIPATTIGQFRRLGFTLLASGVINCIWSAQSATTAGLANPGTVFVPSGIPIGWIDLEATNANAFKTVGSASQIVENSVGGASRIHVFGSGGSGSGSGNANSYQLELEERLAGALFNMFTPNIFGVDGSNKVQAASTGAFDIANQVYTFTAAGQQLLSTGMYDASFLANALDNVSTELDVLWSTIDTAATHEISRDGGLNWVTVAMSRLGVSQRARGTAIFTEPTNVNTQGLDVVNADGLTKFQATGIQAQGVSFVVPPSSKQRISKIRCFVNKLGSPTGFVTAQIYSVNQASAPTSTTLLVESTSVSIGTVATGNQTIEFALVQPLPAGTYMLVLKTDAAYKASYTAGTNEFAWRTDTTTPAYSGTFNTFDGTNWTAVSGVIPTFAIQSVPYDLRVRVTSASSSASMVGYGIFYEEDSLSIQTVVPAATTDPTTYLADGNIVVTVKTVGSTYSMDGTEQFLRLNAATSSSFTVTLPALSAVALGRRYIFKNVNASKVAAVLQAKGTDTIDGASSYTLNATVARESITLISAGSVWDIV